MRNRTTNRTGFSLLELVIVLTILAVLAGLVLAVLPNLVQRTHLSKCADTIVELNKSWARAHALNMRYPDIYDSLLDNGLAELATLPTGLKAEASPEDLNPGEVSALAAIGVRNVVDGAAGATNTYDYAPVGAVARSFRSTPTAMVLNLAAHESHGNLLNLKRHIVRKADGTFTDNRANVRYVIFGIGPNCSGVGTGKIIQEAPVHFGAADEISPASTYQRYLVVFSIVNTNGNYTAYFESAAGNDINGPSSAEVHTEGFHKATAAEG